MTNNLDHLNKLIHEEADNILYGRGLTAILEKYGIPHITGSYFLNLMTWRDLDIYLETKSISEELFFQLGAEINHQFAPVKMSYRNERAKQTEGLPFGLYWGVYLGDERKDSWKIDIWAVDKKEYEKLIKFCNDIEIKLTPSTRHMILEIKSECWRNPEYRRSFTSSDIYEAVLDKGAKTIADFKKYLLGKK